MNQPKTGGAIPNDAIFAYVARDFEDLCFHSLSNGEWVVLLGPRQHGKTTGLVRVASRLQEGGIPCAFLDLQSFANPGSSYDEVLAWLAGSIAAALGLPPPSRPVVSDDLQAWLATCMPTGRGTVALLLDEAAAFPANHRERFFSQMRAIFNGRAIGGLEALANRLVVLFCGTFDPDELITGDNSPFNVCQRIETADLSEVQVHELAQQILDNSVADTAVEPLYSLIGGQPYLLQSALYLMQQRGRSVARAIDELKVRHLSGADGHLPTLLGPFSTDIAAMDTLRGLAQGSVVYHNALSPMHIRLRIAGVCRVVGDRLVLRNELYGEFIRGLPVSPRDRSGGNTTALLLDHSSFVGLQDSTLRNLALDAYVAGYVLLRESSERMALSAFGACLESIFLDYALRLGPTDLAKARAATIGTGKSGGCAGPNPKDWNLNQLILGVAAVYTISGEAAAAHAIRLWRNLIHPARAMAATSPQGGYGPEAHLAAHWIVAVLRDLP